MPAGLAQNIDQQIRCCVEHLRLIAEIICRKHEASQLGDLLHIGQPRRRFHLRQQVQAAHPRGRLGILQAHLIRAASGQTLAILYRHLPGDEKQRPPISDRYEHGRHVRGDRCWRSGQLQSELAQTFVWVSQLEGV
jgi:hypothetical protein